MFQIKYIFIFSCIVQTLFETYSICSCYDSNIQKYAFYYSPHRLLPNPDTLLCHSQCSFEVIQLTSELVIIYSKVLELGVYQISCSFSQDLEVVLIIISNSITYCALKTYIQILKVVAEHWSIPSNIAPSPHTHTPYWGVSS